VVELYDLLVKVTERDHKIVEAARAYVGYADSLDVALLEPGELTAAVLNGTHLWDTLVSAVKGAP